MSTVQIKTVQPPKLPSRAATEQVVKVMCEHYGIVGAWEGLWTMPEIYPGSHEEVSADWIISWEEGPEEWTYDDALQDSIDNELKMLFPKFRAESVNHWCIAIYKI